MESIVKQLMAITGALADEGRVRALLAVTGRELCVCQIIELLGLAPSTVSKHLFLLKQAGLVEARKEGRWMYYRSAGDEAPEAVRRAIEWVKAAAGHEERVRDDRKRLKAICCQDPEDLCRQQAGRSDCCAPSAPQRNGKERR
jgi:ArsR family transcriptional regulator, arsenate/arsenite/antimonite-responsive transcriptional repressor